MSADPHALRGGAVAAREPARIARAAIAVVGVGLWFVTQRLLEARGFPPGIGDGLHQLLAPANAWLLVHPRATDALLAVTSGLIDALGCFLLLSGILGRSIRPMLGLILLFLLRQVTQALTGLPAPEGQAAEKGPSAALARLGARCDVRGVRLARPCARRLATGPF
jgi:hypothetical protein